MTLPIIVCAADLSSAPGAKNILEQGFQVRYIPATNESLCENRSVADSYHILLHIRTIVELLDKSHNIEAIATPSAGFYHIDLHAASQKNISILGLKDVRQFLDRITATAELTWALVLACSRYLPVVSLAVNKGHCAVDEYRGHQVPYKTLGILGYGRLGSILIDFFIQNIKEMQSRLSALFLEKQ